MKHNHPHNHDDTRNSAGQLVPVRFEFTHPNAQTVCLAGTFNDWHPEAKPMRQDKAGHWMKDTALTPGTFEYCLVVDGHYMADPNATESVPNPFGGRNSILRVAKPAVLS